MEGKKKRAVAAAVWVLVILLSSQQQRVLPAADAASGFCQCYASCYPDCRANHSRPFCKVLCGLVCGAGGQAGGGCPGVCMQASLCSTADGDGGEPGAADAGAINDDGFHLVKGTTKRQLLLDLCGLLTQHPEQVAGMPMDAILRGGIRKFPDDAGVLWTCLADHYARMGLHGKARDVFEEGATTATTVKDFRMVFDAYLHFEHAMAAAELSQADNIDIPDHWRT